MLGQGFGQQLAKDVIDGAKQGRRDSQRVLFETFQPAVQRLLLGMCRDQELARDLTQDVFLQAFQKIAQLRDAKALGGWLKQLTVNSALSYFRRPHQASGTTDDGPEVEAQDWLSQSDWLTQLDNIEQLLAQLDDHEYQLIWLYLVEGYQHDELADMFDTTAVVIRQRYHRALKKLKERSQV
jgi:RNA polymerase sigma-70 factor (ECF subfamily)